MEVIDSPKTVAGSYYISYGFTSGRLQGTSLRKALHAAGYTPAHTIDTADIVIAHSAGCWAVRPDISARLIVFIGMPLQDGQRFKTMRASIKNRAILHQEFSRATLLRLSTLSKVYLLVQPRRNIKIIRQAGSFTPPPALHTEQVVFIMNRDDPWPRSPALYEQIEHYSASFIGLSGTHSDVFFRPQEYVAIINSYVARLLA